MLHPQFRWWTNSAAIVIFSQLGLKDDGKQMRQTQPVDWEGVS